MNIITGSWHYNEAIMQISKVYGAFVYTDFSELMHNLLTLARVGGGLHLSVCLLPQNCCLSSIISKSEHATALNLCKELAILLFYKADKFLKVELAQTTQKFENCKNFMYRDEMKRLYNETKASIDASQYIRKIVCEDLWRNVHV